eukprot:TRINITY_DN1780_c2_g1_i5.p1 TRINITY_DN1780_c2_g1~~TRINITY_DN1780_c2_g1_i5.p1  ORF type:complete len:206 (-),score=36.57 TRINITY_DN1780_c2_g1_i5:301-918(-)
MPQARVHTDRSQGHHGSAGVTLHSLTHSLTLSTQSQAPAPQARVHTDRPQGPHGSAGGRAALAARDRALQGERRPGAGPRADRRAPDAEHCRPAVAPDVAASGGEADAQQLAPTTAPFARVNTVAPESPAALSGLLPGDRLVAFGRVTASNHNGLSALVSAVRDSVNAPLTLWVQRDGSAQLLALRLTPRAWAGQGLLGCHILPL